jgi:DNA mismatch repair protein MutS2
VNMDAMRTLEFDKVKERLIHYTMSYLGRARVEALCPVADRRKIEHWQREVVEGLAIIEHGASVPIPSLSGLDRVISLLGKGYILQVDEVAAVGQLLESIGQLKRFLQKREPIAPLVNAYGRALDELVSVRDEIQRCIRHGQVTNEASAALAKVRKKLIVAEERMRKKLDTLVHKYRSYLQDCVVSTRYERYVLPVKKEHKKLVHGTVLDESSSGQTVFIEPAEIAVLQQEVLTLRWEEEQEVSKVLSVLTGVIEQHQANLLHNLEVIGDLDFLFAKAKLAREYGGRKVHLNEQGYIHIVGGRHPLLTGTCVPLDFRIGEHYRALIITGPNTGGKTVCLKTVGLLTMMVQSGLLVPVEEGSSFSIFDDVLVDIGDGQSIEQSLSTFSAHVTNVIGILKQAGPRTLILLDELATGTDPGEGIGLSIAVLEALFSKGATILATTHYNEIKRFAETADGFENARMEFDTESLEPLYRLRIGEAGRSYAFIIAQKLGIPQDIIERSKQIAYGEVLPTSAESIAESKSGPNLATYANPFSSPGNAAGPNQTGKSRISGEKPSSYRGQNKESPSGNEDKARTFQVGDRVWIHPLKKSGIVYASPDARGVVTVLVQKQKMQFHRKRLAPYISRAELYPDDYDLDIVLETKEVRKKRKIMSRKHVPGLSIEFPAE